MFRHRVVAILKDIVGPLQIHSLTFWFFNEDTLYQLEAIGYTCGLLCLLKLTSPRASTDGRSSGKTSLICSLLAVLNGKCASRAFISWMSLASSSLFFLCRRGWIKLNLMFVWEVKRQLSLCHFNWRIWNLHCKGTENGPRYDLVKLLAMVLANTSLFHLFGWMSVATLWRGIQTPMTTRRSWRRCPCGTVELRKRHILHTHTCIVSQHDMQSLFLIFST